MAYSRQTIDRVLAANDLYSVVSPYVDLKRAGTDYLGLCPFHREKTPSFHLSSTKQLYHCFGCGASGNALNFVMSIMHLDFLDAVKQLASAAGIELLDEDESTPQQKSQKDKLLQIHQAACELYHKNVGGAEQYLRNRRLKQSTVEAFKLGFAPNSWDFALQGLKNDFSPEELCQAGICVKNENGRIYDRFRNRLMFPILDTVGRCIAFGGRILGDGQPKYLNSPETALYVKGCNIFGLNTAKVGNRESIIITEGYMDAVSLYQHGITNAGAALGTGFTPSQANLLQRYFKTAYLCYDSDKAGVAAAMRALDVFDGARIHAKVVTLENAKDPDEFVNKYGAAAFEQQLKKAKSATAYRIYSVGKGVDLTQLEQRIKYVSEVAKILSKLDSSVEMDAYVTQVSAKCDISTSAIYSEIKKNCASLFKNNTQREILRDNVRLQAPPIQPLAAPVSNTDKAQAKLLNILFSDPQTLAKIEKLDGDFFDNTTYREIYQCLIDEANANKGDLVHLLAALPDNLAKDAAAIFVMPLEYENNIAAAQDIIGYIQREKQKNTILMAGSCEDLQSLNSLSQSRRLQE